MTKHVSSKDPRKKLVMMKLKQESGGSKITNVTEVGPGRFEGDSMERQLGTRAFKALGRFFVQFETNTDGTLGNYIDSGDLTDYSRFTAIPKSEIDKGV